MSDSNEKNKIVKISKTKPHILKAVKKYSKKPEVQLKIKQYYKDNKATFQARSKLRYMESKEILNKYKLGLLIPIDNFKIKSSDITLITDTVNTDTVNTDTVNTDTVNTDTVV